MRQEQVGTHLYVLASGRLAISRETQGGDHIDLEAAGPGDAIGDVAFMSGGRCTASVSTVTRCELLVVSFTELRVLLDRDSRLTHAFMALSTRRLMNTTKRLEATTQRLKQVEHSLEQLSAFLDLSHATELGTGIEQLLDRLVATASHSIDADRATLFLVDAETGHLWSKIAEGAQLRDIWVPSGAGVAGWVAEHRDLLNIEDAYQDERFLPDVDQRTGYRTRSILCAPIWSLTGDILGVVQVVNKRTGVFTEDDETLIRAFAHQAAIAVENFYLYSQVLASHARMAVLLELSGAINETLDLETLIYRVVSQTTTAMQCDRCSFWVVDHETEELWSMNSSDGEMKEVRMPMTSGLAGHAASRAEMVQVSDAYADPRFNPEVDRHTGYRTRNVLCTPVFNRDGRVIGVTQCINKLEGTFNDDDVRLTEAIAAQIAIALVPNSTRRASISARTWKTFNRKRYR